MIHRRGVGSRVQNYHVRPVRYSLSGGDPDDDRWGAHLVGVFYVVTGSVVLLMPLLDNLGRGTRLWLSILGTPASAASGAGGAMILLAAALIVTGVGILRHTSWGYWAGMLATPLLVNPLSPIGIAVIALVLWVLWQSHPVRERKTSAGS